MAANNEHDKTAMDRATPQYEHRRRRHRRRPHRGRLVLLLEGVVLVACVILAVQLFRQTGKEPLETEPVTTAPTEATEAPTIYIDPSLSDAEAAVLTFAMENDIPVEMYPEELVDLLERNPETEDFVLNYPLEYGVTHEVDLSEYAGSETVPLFMQWDKRWGYLDYAGELAGLSACGPVCLSMVACYLTGDYTISPDKVMEYAINNHFCVLGSGTYWSLINEGGAYYGLDVTEFSPDKQRIFANLEVGNPIICIMGPGDFTSSGHFIVLTGLEDGLIKVNDPNSYANSQKLWDYDTIADQIQNVWVLRNLG